jgi:hypothetical protein
VKDIVEGVVYGKEGGGGRGKEKKGKVERREDDIGDVMSRSDQEEGQDEIHRRDGYDNHVGKSDWWFIGSRGQL